MSVTISLSSDAYTQALLHAAAHPSSAIVGLLVGSRNVDAPAGEAAFNVVSALPLLHHWTALSPMAEVGSALASTHLGTSQQIVGIYHASSSKAKDGKAPSEPEPTAARLAQILADKLESASPSSASQDKGKKNAAATAKGAALLLELNNAIPLSGDSSFSAFLVPSSSSSGAVVSSGKSGNASTGAAVPSSKALPGGSIKLAGGAETGKKAGQAIREGRWKDVVDFDDHLEDTSKDWLTPLAI